MTPRSGETGGPASLLPTDTEEEDPLDRIDLANSALLKWMDYVVTWGNRREFQEELNTGAMEEITTQLENEIREANGPTIRLEDERFLANDDYGLREIADETLEAVAWVLELPTRSGRPFGTLKVSTLPWNHKKLFKGQIFGPVDWQLNGLCERYDNAGECGFDITLSSSASPFTVLHELAHVLAFGGNGSFLHGPEWLFWFLLLVAHRYWDLDPTEALLVLWTPSHAPGPAVA